jgi:predicted transcriptional regulator
LIQQKPQLIMNPYEIPASIQPLPNRALLAAALAQESRWVILKELSKGEPRMTIELARLIGTSPDATAKQMITFRRAGLVEQVYGRLYTIPKQYLPVPGQLVVDFGHCLLRLDAAG